MAVLTAEQFPDEPKLVRVNPGAWPALWLPEVWPVERRAAFLAGWARSDSTEASAPSDAGSIPAASTTTRYMVGENGPEFFELYEQRDPRWADDFDLGILP